MSEPPAPPPHQPPHQPPPGPPSPWGGPPQPPSGRGPSHKAQFWIGFLLAVPLVIGVTVVMGLVGAGLDAAGLSTGGGVGVFSVVPLTFVGLVVMLVFERTRWWAIGLLAGLATALIVAAGACVVLIAAISSGYQ